MDAKKLGEGSVYPSAADEFVDHPVHGYTTKGSLGLSGPTGITLRQHYAGLALEGLMANGEYRPQHAHCKTFAALSVAMADALLAELAKEPQP